MKRRCEIDSHVRFADRVTLREFDAAAPPATYQTMQHVALSDRESRVMLGSAVEMACVQEWIAQFRPGDIMLVIGSPGPATTVRSRWTMVLEEVNEQDAVLYMKEITPPGRHIVSTYRDMDELVARGFQVKLQRPPHSTQGR